MHTQTSIMKLLSLFFIFLFILVSESYNHHTIKRFKCKSFDQQLAKFEECSAKNLGQKKLLNIVLRLYKDVPNPFYLYVIIAKKTKQNYFQDYFRTELINFCAVMEGAKTNPIFRMVLDALGPAGELIHPCPYKAGLLNASNISFDSEKVNIPITGLFKSEITFYNKKKTPLAMMRIDEEIMDEKIKDTKRLQL